MQIDIIGVPVDLGASRRGVDINKRLSDAVAGSLAQGHRPVILGGDHSIAAGSLLGTQRVQGGLTYREAHLAAELIAGSPKLRTIDMVELNPILDHANQTGELAVSLICSMLGKRIFRGTGDNL